MNIKYLTVVIKMPENSTERSKILGALNIDKEFHGGLITAVSCEDEITKIERYEERYGELDG